MTARVLVTGGAGFIGRALVDRLASAGGYEITVVDSLIPQVHGENAVFAEELQARARCLRADVRDRGRLLDAVAGQSIVVHLAAETGTGQSMYEISRHTSVNVDGTAVLLECCSAPGSQVRRVVLASSRAVYGEGRYECEQCGPVWPGSRSAEELQRGRFTMSCPTCDREVTPRPTQEHDPIRPVSIYGVTKHSQEQLVSVHAAARGIESVRLRFQNVYGPGQSLRNPYTGVLSVFAGLLRACRTIEVYEDGLESRDFIHVDDAVEALLRCIQADAIDGAVLNIGTGVATSVEQILAALFEASGTRTPFEISGRFRPGDIRHCFAATETAETLLGFRARRSFLEGVDEYWRWISAQARVIPDVQRSTRELEEHRLILGGRP